MSVKGSTLNIAPVEATVNLLTSADSSVWTVETPNVYKWWERSQQERGPGQDQPAELYVWNPTQAPLTRLSADNALLVEEPTIEIHTYTLSESDTRQFARDIIKYFSEFMSERYRNTTYADIVPTGVEDFREQKLAERTDHYVYVNEIQLSRETTTGV